MVSCLDSNGFNTSTVGVQWSFAVDSNTGDYAVDPCDADEKKRFIDV